VSLYGYQITSNIAMNISTSFSGNAVAFRLSNSTSNLWSRIPNQYITGTTAGQALVLPNVSGIGLLGVFVPSNSVGNSVITTSTIPTTTSTSTINFIPTTVYTTIAYQSSLSTAQYFWLSTVLILMIGTGFSIAYSVYKFWLKRKPPEDQYKYPEEKPAQETEDRHGQETIPENKETNENQSQIEHKPEDKINAKDEEIRNEIDKLNNEIKDEIKK